MTFGNAIILKLRWNLPISITINNTYGQTLEKKGFFFHNQFSAMANCRLHFHEWNIEKDWRLWHAMHTMTWWKGHTHMILYTKKLYNSYVTIVYCEPYECKLDQLWDNETNGCYELK